MRQKVLLLDVLCSTSRTFPKALLYFRNLDQAYQIAFSIYKNWTWFEEIFTRLFSEGLKHSPALCQLFMNFSISYMNTWFLRISSLEELIIIRANAHALSNFVFIFRKFIAFLIQIGLYILGLPIVYMAPLCKCVLS